ncbi:unnamed protein product [Cylicostephanus goldi]|uniref:Uncharacterized protein n=1 Tax=Cylicostephanus goldi TaxID=71465 RepID=A0A3P6SJQ8_CYLGO|nr:unnamed protein product [Cylicostephanus goldi]
MRTKKKVMSRLLLRTLPKPIANLERKHFAPENQMAHFVYLFRRILCMRCSTNTQKRNHFHIAMKNTFLWRQLQIRRISPNHLSHWSKQISNWKIAQWARMKWSRSRSSPFLVEKLTQPQM